MNLESETESCTTLAPTLPPLVDDFAGLLRESGQSRPTSLMIEDSRTIGW
jgi:hypothetical protein